MKTKMKDKSIQFKGFRLKGNPQKIAERLMELYEAHGESLDSEIVIDDAQDKDSPLHGIFDWNDKTAAHQHRLEQARKLIQSAVIVREKEDGEKVVVRAFVNIQQTETGKLTHSFRSQNVSRYVTITHAMQDDELRAYTFEQAHRELMNWRRKYHQLNEFEKLFLMIDKEYA